MNKSSVIGLFGGTFNPPHIGHAEIAKEAMSRFGLQKVVFIPSHIPPHKDPKNTIDASHRAEMVKLLIENKPDCIFSDYEASKRTVSYSIDTIKHYMSSFPGKKFYFITGSDAFYYIDTWKDYSDVLRLIEFIVYERENYSREKIASKFPDLKGFKWIEGAIIRIASSDIRLRLRNGENCVEELGEKVYEYIEKNGLYRK